MRSLIMWKHAAFLLALCVLVGCASFPRTPAHPTDDDRFQPRPPISRPGVPDDRPPPRVILPGDQIMIEVASTKTSKVSEIVDAAGNVHVALVGDVKVGGLSLTDAEAKLRKALQRYDKFVQVNLTVSQESGHTVSILGAVVKPGVVKLPPGARVSDVLMLAGGGLRSVINGELVSGADMGEAKLIRDGHAMPIDFRRAMQGDPLHNIYVRAQDQIFVPPERGRRVIVLGAGGPAVFQWAPGMRLTEALARGGGVPPAGDKHDIRVLRGPMEAPRVYQTSIRDIVDGESHDPEIYPGDIVWVDDHWIEDFGEVMAVLGPVLGTGLSLTALILVLNSNNADGIGAGF
ncbi:MAG: polysaccharide biosynthesis/export family protein [Myxococcales bacterium]|nr:polysaccharide biosynthesis/export family protein [Myxococcales bacterium]